MPDPDSSSEDVFDVKRIRRLVELMQEIDLTEIDLQQGDQRIQLKRGTPPQITAHVAPPLAAVPAPGEGAPAASGPPAAEDESDAEHVVYIKSPMVGTFYSKANPDTPMFVEVGDSVDPDTTVCIVEAMKVFNEIRAEVSGKIVAVLCENEEPVDYGKPLFKVDTSQ